MLDIRNHSRLDYPASHASAGCFLFDGASRLCPRLHAHLIKHAASRFLSMMIINVIAVNFLPRLTARQTATRFGHLEDITWSTRAPRLFCSRVQFYYQEVSQQRRKPREKFRRTPIEPGRIFCRRISNLEDALLSD